MAWQLLFGSEYGQFSLFVIVFIIAMAVWFARYFKRKMIEDEKRAATAARDPAARRH